MNKKLRGIFLLLLTALVWGVAFVAQSAGMDYIQPFTFNGIRTLLGGISLLPVVYFTQRKKTDRGHDLVPQKRVTIIGGIFCGICLFIASSLQQAGISYTTAGKAGFITALYIVIVPVLGIFLRRRIPLIAWLCVLIATVGFYLLSIHEDFTISKGDLLVLLCAFGFSAHILCIDHFNEKGADGLLMSCIQFFVSGFISIIFMFLTEKPVLSAIWDARLCIAYAGIMSCGMGYTLQIIGQKYTPPTTASLLLSLESVFAAISGWFILGEAMSAREIAGCALVFAAVLAAQIPVPGTKKS